MGELDLVQTNELIDVTSILEGKEVTSKVGPNNYIYYVKEPEELFLVDLSNISLYSRTAKKFPELKPAMIINDFKLLMAVSGRYIPVYDKESRELIVSKEDFLELRKKMSGLNSMGAGDFIFSDNLYFDGLDPYLEQIDENFKKIEEQRKPVVSEFIKIMTSIGLNVTLGCNSGGDVELVEAGSTSRGTNVPQIDENAKWDFDFTVRIDENNMWKVKNTLENGFNAKEHITETSRYKVRLIDVIIPGLSKEIDLDFYLANQKEKYISTEMTIQERLDNMRQRDYEKYRLVLANIMYAKDYLKHSGAYKPSRGIINGGDRSYGGLGAIGIENWILQNGGSFIDASKDFLEHAEGKDFIEFEKEYAILDFGKNHVSVSGHRFPYDNFIMNNMRPNGYLTMIAALQNFIEKLNQKKI